MVKKYVLDTNILLSSPDSMVSGFEDNIVIICSTVLQELDRKKTQFGEIGYNAREACRILDDLRTTGDLLSGVKTKNGGTLVIEPDGISKDYLPEGYDLAIPDNRILSTCFYLQNRKDGKISNIPVILVTNDISMRINATTCGINVESYRNSQVPESGYTGMSDLNTSEEIINRIYKECIVPVEDIDAKKVFVENEFVTLHAGKQSALTTYRNGFLNLVKPKKLIGGITPKNAAQSYALDALLNPDIPLVFLMGAAGTAKSFLSIAAGLTQTYTDFEKEGQYYRILISRPAANTYESVGFLPGDLDDKVRPLIQPIIDNLEIILAGQNKEKENRDQINIQIEDLFDTGIIESTSLSFIRGRSLTNTYIICDEAQNGSRELVRDVITRAGEGTKVVICGDVNQIDVPTLDKKTCGLSTCYEAMIGSPLAAFIKFPKDSSVRSALAKDAIKRIVFH